MSFKKNLKVLASSFLLLGLVGATVSCKNNNDDTTTENERDTYLDSLIISVNAVMSNDFTVPNLFVEEEITWSVSDSTVAKITKGDKLTTIGITRPDTDKDITLTATVGEHTKTWTFKVRAVTVSEIANAYKFSYDGAVLGEGEYNLPTESTYLTKKATIAWTLDATDSADIVKLEGSKLTVTDPKVNVPFKLTATFTYGGSTSTRNFALSSEFKAELTAEEKIQYWFDNAENGEAQTLSGYVVYKSIPSSGRYNIFMVDESYSGGVYIYRADITETFYNSLSIGTAITLSGATSQDYNGLVETNSGSGEVTLNTTLPAYDATKAVTAIDKLLFVQDISGTDSLLLKQNSIVSLTGWKVSAINEKLSTSGSSADLVTLSKTVGDVTQSVRVSWSSYYTPKESEAQTAMFTQASTLKVGDVVDVQGLLGYTDVSSVKVKNEIILTDATKLVKSAVQTESTVEYTNISSAKATLDSINVFPSVVTTDQTIEWPATAIAAGVTFSAYGMSIVSSSTGIQFLPQSYFSTAVITATIEADGFKFNKKFTVVVQDLDEQGMIDFTFDELKDTVDNRIATPTQYTLPSSGKTFGDVTATYALDGEPTTAKIVGNKLQIINGKTAETVKLVVTYTNGGTTSTKTYSIKVAAYSVTAGEKVASQTGKFFVYGEITELKSNTNGQCTLKTADGTLLTVYRIYATFTGAFSTLDPLPKVGDKVLCYGTYSSQYKNVTLYFIALNPEM